MLRNLLVLLVIAFTITGCNDRYDEGYAAGYEDGIDAGEKIGYEKAQTQYETKSRTAESYYSSRYVTTEVCGGSGVNVNGKHYAGGKTGCVRVFSDGSIQRY